MLIYMNGKLVPKDEARVSVYDHGFLYGDGIFEGIRIYKGCVFRLNEHIDRLFESAKTLSLEIGMDHAEMVAATLETIVANGLRDGYIRLVVSRGEGDLGIDPYNCKKATLIIIVDTISLYPKEFYETGIPLVTASTRRIPLECVDPRIKSLNYLNNILAKIEARKAGVPEAIMLNLRGRVAECTADNIFMTKNGSLLTPRLTEGALPGVTRATVLELAKAAGIKTKETVLGLHDFYNADECFLTGTGAEIVPVISIDGRQIGDGKPGLVTHQMRTAFNEVRVKDGAMVEYEVESVKS